MRETKPFFKITFQDLEIAEEFFDNEKQFSEFILAVSYYYRSKNYQIKNKNVQKYFKTYQKTMDNIIEAKSFGKKGAEIKAENQQVTECAIEGGVKGSLKDTLPTNYKVLSINNKEQIINDKILNYRSFDHLFISVFDFNKLIDFGYSKEEIDETIDEIENYKKNTSYKSLYLTAKKWLGKKNNIETKTKSGILNFD